MTVCDTLKTCYLVNIQTREETELQSSIMLELDPSNTDGYSIRCEGNGADELDFIKFFYDGIVQDEFGLPRYMKGDSDNGAYINKAEYISTCGLKTMKIEGHVWDRKCFEKEFIINVSNPGGASCDGKPPIAAPVPAPVHVPISQPVAAPATTPTCPHPKVWKDGCCKDPSPSCVHPKQWMDGICKDTCSNDFVCPANSIRIANRSCYDNFDDCQCKYGYYKSLLLFEAKCIRHLWYLW